jgi:hypothetical protein
VTWARVAAALALGLLSAATGESGQVAPDATPDLDQILERYLAAIGGAARWDAVEALEVRGTLTAFSESAPFVLRRRRPNLYRIEHVLLRRPVVMAYDGRRAWWDNPIFAAAPGPAPMPPVEAEVFQAEVEFDSALLHYREKGHELALIGREPFEGRDAFKLRVTRSSGAQETWVLDAETYLEVARICAAAEGGERFEQQLSFADYRQVEGLRLPFRIDAEYFIRNVVIEVEQVRVNPEIDAAVFAFPAAPATQP